VARLLSVSLPDDLMTETEALAETRGKTKSEFVRDPFAARSRRSAGVT